MEITYESIKPIIIKEELEDQLMVVHFKADGQEQHIVGHGAMPLAAKKVVANAAATAVKQGVIQQAISFLSGLVGGAIGGGAGSIASSATSQTGYAAANQAGSNDDVVSKIDDTPANRHAAVVAAFNTIKAHFVWDEATGKWKALVQEKS